MKSRYLKIPKDSSSGFGLFCWGLLIIVSVFIVYIASSDLTAGPSGLRWVGRSLKNMSLREKIGQMIICRYIGRFVNQESDYFAQLKHLIEDQHIGGLIMFRGMVYETAALTNACQDMADIPLLIASDLERGLGHQVIGAVDFPPMMGLGATRSEKLAYSMGEITAREGRAVGIHMTFAPVVDVNVNPKNPIINTRSIGEDPELVARLSISFMKGCQKNGMLVTAKHFPGHGDTDKDSHSTLPTLNIGKERLENVELYPFRAAIDSGVQAIMTAHLWIPALEPAEDLPATLSPAVLTGLLRKDLGFQGLIVSDAMEMGGITTVVTPEVAAIKAVQAGVDILLLPLEPDKTLNALCLAVRKGDISEERINESVLRILKTKAMLKLHKERFVDIQHLNRTIAKKSSEKRSTMLYERSLTLIQNKDNVFPLEAQEAIPTVISLNSDTGNHYAGSAFIDEVKKRVPEARGYFAGPSTDLDRILRNIEFDEKNDVIVLALFSRMADKKGHLNIHRQHVRFIKSMMEKNLPVIAISFGSPYFIEQFPGVDGYLCAYHHSLKAQVAAAKALFGEILTSGKLPVSIPDLYPYGHGL